MKGVCHTPTVTRAELLGASDAWNDDGYKWLQPLKETAPWASRAAPFYIQAPQLTNGGYGPKRRLVRHE